MFERCREPLLDRTQFLHHLGQHLFLAVGALVLSWGIGLAGYYVIVGQAWIDAVLNSAMILARMGPEDPILTDASNLFAALGALFSGIVLMVAAGVRMAGLGRQCERLTSEA